MSPVGLIGASLKLLFDAIFSIWSKDLRDVACRALETRPATLNVTLNLVKYCNNSPTQCESRSCQSQLSINAHAADIKATISLQILLMEQ